MPSVTALSVLVSLTVMLGSSLVLRVDLSTGRNQRIEVLVPAIGTHSATSTGPGRSGAGPLTRDALGEGGQVDRRLGHRGLGRPGLLGQRVGRRGAHRGHL